MKLSAILSPFRSESSSEELCVSAWFLSCGVRLRQRPCGPSPEIRAQLEKITVIVSSAFRFRSGPGPPCRPTPKLIRMISGSTNAIRMRSNSIGIEGHLRKLTEEYQVLSMQHSGDLMYSYLYSRSLMGRNTSAAAQQMTEIAADHPDFAPGAWFVGGNLRSSGFPRREQRESPSATLSALCPGSEHAGATCRVPDPKSLIDQAESLLAQNAAPGRIAPWQSRAVRDDEWRLQRIRPFDWYTVDYKRQAQRELQAKYWRL